MRKCSDLNFADPHQWPVASNYWRRGAFSDDQMRCRKTDEFTGRNGFGLLGEPGDGQEGHHQVPLQA
jgi:hypothetical protein